MKSNVKTKPAIVNLDLESYWSNGEPLSPRVNFFKPLINIYEDLPLQESVFLPPEHNILLLI